MEEVSQDFQELSRELLEEFADLGRRMSPHMKYAARGERGVMRALACSDAPLTPTELAERTHLSSARVANVLRALEEKGLVTREHSSQDRRRVTVSATQAGRAEVESQKREFEAQAGAFLAQLGADDTREALRILRRTNQIIDENRANGTAVIPGSPDQKGGMSDEDR